MAVSLGFFPGEDPDPWVVIDALKIIPAKQYPKIVRKMLKYLENNLEKMDIYSISLLLSFLKDSKKQKSRFIKKP